jgi:hypothetical protein
MALQLAKKGFDIVLTYQSKSEFAQEVVNEIKNSGKKAFALQLDVADANSFDQFATTLAATLKNELVYQYGPYFGVIYPFVEGIPPGPSDYTCSEVGKAIATLHSLKHDTHLISKLRTHEEVGFGAKEILDYTNSSKCPSDFKEYFIKFFPDLLSEFISTPFEKGIIHGDLYYDNTLFNNNTQILTKEYRYQNAIQNFNGKGFIGFCQNYSNTLRSF